MTSFVTSATGWQNAPPRPTGLAGQWKTVCYLLESNRWGLERGVQFSGGSCIIEPDGNIAAVVDNGNGIAYAEIDINRSRQRQALGEPVFINAVLIIITYY
ncbi:hypothetical protein LNO36_00185 [Klebsiella variicola subsp. variicola]|nr:hypothetical protein [Klebsiella variicola subsp. variicola]